MIKTTKRKIDPERWYTLQDIIKGRMFPWVRGRYAAKTVVAADRKNVLKCMITGTGRATKYNFKGKNIIKFVEQFEAGKIKI